MQAFWKWSEFFHQYLFWYIKRRRPTRLCKTYVVKPMWKNNNKMFLANLSSTLLKNLEIILGWTDYARVMITVLFQLECLSVRSWCPIHRWACTWMLFNGIIIGRHTDRILKGKTRLSFVPCITTIVILVQLGLHKLSRIVGYNCSLLSIIFGK